MAVALVATLLAASACTPDGNLIVGPIRASQKVGSATFLQSLFLPKTGAKGTATITHRQRFCDMPSEAELSGEVLEAGGIDFSRFIALYRLELVQTTITARDGDFDFLTGMTVRYIPVPGAGDPVELGTASDPSGLGTEIVLVPPEDVDFLELIRANDAANSEECPQLEFELTFTAPPLHDVRYRVDVTVDAFVEVGRMS